MTEATDRALGVAEQATADAEAAAQRSGVRVRTLSELADLSQVVDLFRQIWGNPGPPMISLELMRALAHAGNYVAAAYDIDDETMLGASLGFFATPVGRVLHSDITGVAVDARSRRLGFALKLHQRAWALGHGISEITWTYDPLVARNAHLNLSKLRARAIEYIVDFYGEMDDGINAGQGSDRLLCSWSLASPDVIDACRPEPRPVPPPAGQVQVAIPPDIEALRRSDPSTARQWRMAVRERLGSEISRGGRVVGFNRADGYVVQPATAEDIEG